MKYEARGNFCGLRLQPLLEDLNNFYNHAKIEPKDINIIPNKYEYKASSSAEAMSILRKFYGQYVKEDFAIRKSEDFNISAKVGKPLAFFSKKNSIALEDLLDLVFQILDKYTSENFMHEKKIIK